MKVEFYKVAPKELDAFVIGGVYEDGNGDYFLLTKNPDDSGYVWVNLTKSVSSSVIDERTAHHTASMVEYIPDAKLVVPKEAPSCQC